MTTLTSVAVATTARPANPRPRRFRGRRAGVSLMLWLYAAITITPLAIMLANSLHSTSQLYADPLDFFAPPTLDGYLRAWSQASFGTYFMNSLLVTAGSVALSTIVSLPAAYALARWTFFGRSLVENLFISGLMIPVMLTILPLFYLIDSMRLIDSLGGLALIYAANGVPFSVFVLAAFFRQLPAELEEAARMDGAGYVATFTRVMLPLVRPAIATIVVFRVVPIWNDFFFPLVFLRSDGKNTIPVGLTTFFGEYSTDWSPLFAGLVIATLPLVVLFLVATKQIVAGLTAGIGK